MVCKVLLDGVILPTDFIHYSTMCHCECDLTWSQFSYGVSIFPQYLILTFSLYVFLTITILLQLNAINFVNADIRRKTSTDLANSERLLTDVKKGLSLADTKVKKLEYNMRKALFKRDAEKDAKYASLCEKEKLSEDLDQIKETSEENFTREKSGRTHMKLFNTSPIMCSS